MRVKRKGNRIAGRNHVTRNPRTIHSNIASFVCILRYRSASQHHTNNARYHAITQSASSTRELRDELTCHLEEMEWTRHPTDRPRILLAGARS